MESAADACLRTYQEAFRAELANAIKAILPTDTGKVLDAPCGTGFYTEILGDVMQGGELVAADSSAKGLTDAKARLSRLASLTPVKFITADVYHLPFPDQSFDFVWCAQSFISLDRPIHALREFWRILKDGGTIAVLETDEYHHVLLPWDVDLECAIQRAVRDESCHRFGDAAKLSQSRGLRKEFQEAGLIPWGKQTVVADRAAPWEPIVRKFLGHHFEHLREFIRQELTERELAAFDRATACDSPKSLLNRSDVDMTCIATISQARRDSMAWGCLALR